MIKVFCAGNGARVACDQWLTRGTVGAVCEFDFDSTWDGLQKTAVFIAGDTQRDVVLTENQCIIPWEVLTQEGTELIVGVHGVDAGGTMAVPTIYASVGAIRPGADPSGDVSTEPSLPVWAQMQSEIGNLEELETEDKTNLVNAINEAAQSGGGGGGTGWTAYQIDLLDRIGDALNFATAEGGQLWDALITSLREGEADNPDAPSGRPIIVSYSGSVATINNLKSLAVAYTGTAATIGA